MKINHNMSAVITNHQLLNNENSLSVSMEKLSSGLRINHAKDDAAGMAISTKMRAQIQGLNQASRNASDGNSILQTADGALNEVTSMIQRMRELAVQAANETNTDDDKDSIQDEIESLKKEIDRVSTDTEFNTKTLFNGSLDTRVYGDHVSRISVSDAVAAGKYNITIDEAATQAVYNDPLGAAVTTPSYVDDNGDTAADLDAIPDDAAGVVVINGREIKIEAGDTATEVYGKLREGAELGECSINPLIQAGGIYVKKDADYTFGDPLQLTSDFYGSGSQVKISCDNEKLAQFLGLPMSNADNIPTGKDAKLTIDATSAFGNHCTYTTDGNKITITNRSGFEISFLAEEGYSDTTPIQLDVTNIGTLTLQIGANEHQTMDVRIPEISTDSLYIDNLDVTTVNGADRAIMQLDDALEKVSSARSKIGAYQNRLDHAINSLEQEGQDMTAALSRIEDVDMAGEMTEYTKDNVLTQAATSVLAQANDIPQQVLQLLQ